MTTATHLVGVVEQTAHTMTAIAIPLPTMIHPRAMRRGESAAPKAGPRPGGC
ncbi:MAG TPA: hypothetical protein VG187_12470 [Mycobacterium sp.]|nr:hypothetical protein [Mycobacterium sp.]